MAQNQAEEAGVFGVKSDVYDFCFEVEGKELFAPKVVLSMQSPVFGKICNDESFKEAREGRAILKDEKYKEILGMLKCCVPHPALDRVTDESLPFLLKLARCYDIPLLRDACNLFLEHRMELLKPEDMASFRYFKLLLNNNEENAYDGMIEKLIRYVSNLPVALMAVRAEDIPMQIRNKLMLNMLEKFGSGYHSIYQADRADFMNCEQCEKPTQWFKCNFCNRLVCSDCLTSIQDPTRFSDHNCIGDKRSCRKCHHRNCLCEF